jgi:hypothetical protein
MGKVIQISSWGFYENNSDFSAEFNRQRCVRELDLSWLFGNDLRLHASAKPAKAMRVGL